MIKAMAPTFEGTTTTVKPVSNLRKKIGLYIHFPWCLRKCPYCDFNSHESNASKSENQILYEEYLQALLLDLEYESIVWAGQHPLIASIFIGGGTPSLAPGWFYERLLNQVKRLFSVADNLEVTLEANPGAINHDQYEYDRFEHYLAAGVNRISLGVQSFSAEHLKALGRIHSVDQVYKAFESARNAGFKRINIDIMFGLPDQSVQQGLSDLNAAIALFPEHLSWYQLTIEPNTVFYTKPPTLNLDISHELWGEGRSLLAAKGFLQYEVSAYAQKGEICRQNELYWRFGDYAAIGAGAHGKFTQDQQVWRYQKTRLPAHYVQRMNRVPRNSLPEGHPFVGQAHVLSREDLHIEYGLNRFRLLQPVTSLEYEQATQRSFHELLPWLERQAHKKLLTFDQQGFSLTALGSAFLDDLLADY